MGIYTVMKKLIMNENNKLENGEIDQESYDLWKNNCQNKLDVFYARNRLTQGQYEELSGMFVTDGQKES